MKQLYQTLALILALALSASTLAVPEGQVQQAPDIDLYDALPAPAADGSYLPDPSVYGAYLMREENDNGSVVTPIPTMTPTPVYMPTPTPTPLPMEMSAMNTPAPIPVAGIEPEPTAKLVFEWWDLPGLTPYEAARTEELLEAYRRGEQTGDGESVLNRLEGVVVGVYALDPAEYDGECAYVLLPNKVLTDEQILAVIDAFHRLGLTFDPDALSYRNCTRGGTIESSRWLTDEEQARLQSIMDNIRAGRINPADVSEEARRSQYLVSLHMSAHGGLDLFQIYPYRSMTDDELVALAFASGEEYIGNITFYENEAYALARALGAGLSTTVENTITEIYAAVKLGETGKPEPAGKIPSVYVYSSCVDGEGQVDRYQAMFNRETGEVFTCNWRRSMDYASEYAEDVFFGEEYYLEIARRQEEKLLESLRRAGMTCAADISAASLECMAITGWDGHRCLACRAELNDGWIMEIYVRLADGAVCGAQVTRYPPLYSSVG